MLVSDSPSSTQAITDSLNNLLTLAHHSYDFTVLQPGTMETTGVDCTKMLGSDGSLPAVTDGTCTDSSRTWTVTKPAAGGLVLTVSQPVTPSSNQTGSYTIPASDLEYTQTGASTQQSYTGPTAFNLS